MMNKNPFMVGFSAIFLVFSLLLVSLIYTVYEEERERPTLYNCLVYKGNLESLKRQLEVESRYIDRFVILQSREEESIEENEKQQLLKLYPQKAIFITVSHLPREVSSEAFQYAINPHFKKGLGECEGRDVLIFSSAGESIEFTSLYRSLKSLSKNSQRVFKFYPQGGDKSLSSASIKVMTYEAYSKSWTPTLKTKLKIKEVKPKKRNFFFQTKPIPKELACS